VVNNLRDLDTDEKAGKRTLAVRIGPSATRAQYILLLGVGLAIPVVGWALTNWPPTTLLALLVAPAMVRPARTVVLHSDPRELLPTLGQTARLVAVYGALLGGGLVVG